MQFILEEVKTVYNCITDSDEIETLRKLGFTFREPYGDYLNEDQIVVDETPLIEINTLEELFELQDEIDYPLIILDKSIEIYNGYREPMHT